MLDDAVILDDGLHIAGVVKTVEVVEASVDRPIGNCGTHWRRFVLVLAVRNTGFRIQVLKIKVPLSNDGRVISNITQE